MALSLSELARASGEIMSLPWATPMLTMAPKGDGHPVIVLPGLMADDAMTVILRRFLFGLGYVVHRWELGRNFGPRSIGEDGEKLAARLEEVHAAAGRKVSLVGWSLGGVMARELARTMPDKVRQVVTLGSPIHSVPRGVPVEAVYEFLSGEDLRSPEIMERVARMGEPLDVPSSAIYSRTDGVVPWRSCVTRQGRCAENIEVVGSHMGLVANAAVLFAIADRLAQGEGEWRPFDRQGWKAFVYPVPVSGIDAL